MCIFRLDCFFYILSLKGAFSADVRVCVCWVAWKPFWKFVTLSHSIVRYVKKYKVVASAVNTSSCKCGISYTIFNIWHIRYSKHNQLYSLSIGYSPIYHLSHAVYVCMYRRLCISWIIRYTMYTIPYSIYYMHLRYTISSIPYTLNDIRY